MRVARIVFVCVTSALIAVSASAQQAGQPPTRTVDDYLCTFASQCSNQAPPPEQNASPAVTRGFHLSVPEPRRTSPDRPGAATSPQASQVQRVDSAPAPAVVRHNQSTGQRVTHAAAKPSPAATRRMDLRLSFLLGSAELTSEARDGAKIFAEALLRPQLADKRFLIEGHTDSSGSRAANMDLSRRRAAAVVDYLNSLGVGRDRLEVRGYGPDRPLPGLRPNSPQNRRVEARLL